MDIAYTERLGFSCYDAKLQNEGCSRTVDISQRVNFFDISVNYNETSYATVLNANRRKRIQ
jgi:hypothetical protein